MSSTPPGAARLRASGGGADEGGFASGERPGYDVVIASAGRASLAGVLAALASSDGPRPERVIVVDDRIRPQSFLPVGPVSGWLAQRLRVLPGPGRGPAAARNTGCRAARAEWVAFLDDDVVPEPAWAAKLAGDLCVGASVGASQGRIDVPSPTGRRPTDAERNVAGLRDARWATADMAYRRAVLAAVGGFDERFPRAYREDSDLGLRVTRAGWAIVRGTRTVTHPVWPARAGASLAKQAGNADDVLMRALHGADWRRAAGAPPGRRRRHLTTAGAGVVAAGAALSGRRSLAALAGTGWAFGTGELAWARIAPGPRTPAEIVAMSWTSVALPFAAAGWWLVGWAGLRGKLADVASAPHGELRAGTVSDDTVRAGSVLDVPLADRAGRRPAAVLFDRDGTLVVDVPYNGDPDRVQLVPTAHAALAKLRAAGVLTGVVSNQSGVARGLLTAAQVRAVNARIDELLGPLGPWAWCPHGPDDGCGCRKPRPGLVLEAASRLGVDPRDVVVVGDIGADVDAALAAGARAVLVPTPTTLPQEIAEAPSVAADLEAAVDLVLAGRA